MKYDQLVAISCILIGTLLCLLLQDSQVIIFLYDQYVSNLKVTNESDFSICTSESIQDSRATTFGFDVPTLRENFANGQPDLKIRALLSNQSNENSMNTFQQTFQLSLPWIGMLFLFCLEFIFLNFCYCDCCPPKCCTCCDTCCRKPLIKKELQRNSIILIICTLAIIGSGTAGMILLKDFINHASNISCSSLQITQSISTGNNNGDILFSGWIGLQSMLNVLTQIQGQFNTFIYQSNALQTQINMTQLNESYNSLINVNKQIPIELSNYSYYANNSAISQLVNGTVKNQDSYVKNQTNNIYPQQQLFTKLYYNMINQINQIQVNALSIVKQQSSIINGISNGRESVISANDQILSFQSQLIDFHRNIDTNNEVETISLYTYFGCVIGVSLMIAILIVLIGMYDMKESYLRYMLCGGCCLYYIVVFVGFILCIAFVIINGYLAQGCDYFYDALQNNTEFNQISYVGSNQDFTSISNECIFGQGNLLKQYHIVDSLSAINNLQISIKTFQNSWADYNFSVNSSLNQLKLNRDFITNFINGTSIDYPNGSVPNSYFTQVQQANWQPVYIAENETLAQNNQTQSILNNTLKTLSTYFIQTNEFFGYLSDPYTGILNNANCSFIKNITNVFVDGVCEHYFVETYNMYILFGIISVSIFIALFFIFKILIQQFYKKQLASNQKVIQMMTTLALLDHEMHHNINHTTKPSKHHRSKKKKTSV